MISADGARVLEFNCRFGDPETQAILPRMKSDLLPLLEATIDGKIDNHTIEWDERAAVTVVLASGGYPEKYETGKPISGLDDAAKLEAVYVFHAGTKRMNGEVVTAGGRVLAVTALGSTIEAARSKRLRGRIADSLRRLPLSARYCSQRHRPLASRPAPMFRVIWLASIGFLIVITALAQSPTPSPSPAASAAAGSKSSAPAPTTEELINSLNAADLQATIALLKSNFTNPDAINETQLNRATLEGLMVRLGPGLMLLPDKGHAPSEPPSPFYGEVLEGHIGYLRPGAFTTANLQAMEKKLAEFAAKKIDALTVDLRASSASDFNISSEFAKRFCPKSKMLFSLRKQGKQDRVFNSDRDPSYQGLIVMLADADTAGGVEAFAGALRFYDKALIIGQPTAGRAVEYSDLPLPSGKILRVAVSEAVSPDGHSLYPAGVKAGICR